MRSKAQGHIKAQSRGGFKLHVVGPKRSVGLGHGTTREANDPLSRDTIVAMLARA